MKITDRTFMVSAAGEQLQVRLLKPESLVPDDSTPTLVLLHEALGSIAQWRDFPEALVKTTGLPTLIYDRCGFGGSQPIETPRGLDYLAREVESLDHLLSACAVTKPLLLGHSDGATIALLYAATFPERPLAVISEAAHLFVEEETLTGIKAAVERWRTTDLRQKLARYHGANADKVFFAWTETWLDPAFREWNVEVQIKHIVCPILAIQGEDDEFGTVQQVDSITALVSGSCQIRMIAACGHTPHYEAKDVVLAEMTNFIGDLSRLA